jgi:hypothetical protein
MPLKIRAILTTSFVTASLAVAASVELRARERFRDDPSELARRSSVRKARGSDAVDRT